jgi:hypothetical protein
MSRYTNWALAALLAGILALGSALEGPHELDTAQAVANNKQAVQTDKLVLEGQP